MNKRLEQLRERGDAARWELTALIDLIEKQHDALGAVQYEYDEREIGLPPVDVEEALAAYESFGEKS